MTLSRMRARKKAVQPILLETTQDKEWQLRRSALLALGKIREVLANKTRTSCTEDVIDILSKGLSDEKREVRKSVVESLEKIGVVWPTTVAEVNVALKKAINDTSWKVRKSAVQALGKIGVALAQVESKIPNSSFCNKELQKIEKILRFALEDEEETVKQSAAKMFKDLANYANVPTKYNGEILILPRTNADK